MKTKGGFKVIRFKKIKYPDRDTNLEPLIFEGLVQDIPFLFPVEHGEKETFDSIVKWDKFGRCRNIARQDCFIEIPLKFK